MPRRPSVGQVLRVTGPITLDWGNGTRITLSPDGLTTAPKPALAVKGRAGRKPSPATQALISMMAADTNAGRTRSRADYLAALRAAGHKGSDLSADVIVSREAKRAFGKPLGRKRGKAVPRRGGRRSSSATVALRAKLQKDKADGGLQKAAHYVRWLVDHAKIGLKQARPVVYRELRAAR